MIERIKGKKEPKFNKVLWACSVVIQNPENNEVFHAMGQMVSFQEEEALDFVKMKAFERFPSYDLVSTRAIPIHPDAMREVLEMQ